RVGRCDGKLAEKSPDAGGEGGRRSRRGAERLAYPLTSPEQQRFDGGRGHAEGRCKLVVGEATELAEDEGAALPARKLGEGAAQRLDLDGSRSLVRRIRSRGGRLGDGQRPPHLLLDSGAAFVSRNRREPGGRGTWGRGPPEGG